jgi:glycosyltransferase involved in cell wall biosynthesis
MTQVAPEVTVLMPVWNAAPWLSRALRSLCRQTLRELEVLVVDDGSTDDSPTILRRFRDRDPRFRVLTLPRRIGLVAALNAGLAEAGGRFLARCDADDICHEERLERQVAFLAAHREVTVAGCRVAIFPRRTLEEGYHRYEDWVNGIVTPEDHHRERFVEATIPHPTAMMRTTEIRALRGYRDAGWPEDLDLWLRVHASGGRLEKIPEVLYFWRDHPGRASRQDPRYKRSAFLRAKAHHLARDALLVGRAVIIWGAGPIGRQLGRMLRAEGVRIVAHVDIDPRKIGRSLRGAPIIASDDLAAFEGVPVLAAVGSRGARSLIRRALRRMGRVEGQDFLAVV